MHPCNLRAMYIIGACGGRSQHMQAIGVSSKTISLNGSRELKKKSSSQNSPEYN